MQSDMIVLGNAEQAKSCWNQREVLLFCRGAGDHLGGCPGPAARGASHPSCRRGCAAMAPVKVEEATLTARAASAVAAATKEMKRANCSGKIAVWHFKAELKVRIR